MRLVVCALPIRYFYFEGRADRLRERWIAVTFVDPRHPLTPLVLHRSRDNQERHVQPSLVQFPPLAVPLFSWSYELLFPQALSFEKDLRCYGGVPAMVPTVPSVTRFFRLRFFVLNNLWTLFSLFGLFFRTRAFVFSGLRTLLQKQTGVWGSAGPGAKRRPRGQCSRAHAESRAERWRDIA